MVTRFLTLPLVEKLPSPDVLSLGFQAASRNLSCQEHTKRSPSTSPCSTATKTADNQTLHAPSVDDLGHRSDAGVLLPMPAHEPSSAPHCRINLPSWGPFS